VLYCLSPPSSTRPTHPQRPAPRGAGTRHGRVKHITLSDAACEMLLALVARTRGVIGEQISHTFVVECLIKEAWERDINVDEATSEWQGEVL
jgi:hypothetical protein